jgi:precorrin-3B C17-methyltransferase
LNGPFAETASREPGATALAPLWIVGLGPGPADWMTTEAMAVLDAATDIVGYGPYVDRIALRDGQRAHGSDNRVEVDRARAALALAMQGRRVAVVSGGDPGVFAMAAAVFEAIEAGDPAWRSLDVRVAPGVSAMQAASARLGAPLGHDFCAISLSDNLKPWDVVARRLEAAAGADFIIALYNPASRARPDQIQEAFALLRRVKPAETVVAFARAVGRTDERILVTTLAAADPAVADMSTLVLIGSTETRLLHRTGGTPAWVYTPRHYGRGR